MAHTSAQAGSGRLRFVVLLLVVLIAGMATPAMAGKVIKKAKNADKVDGLHAVKAGDPARAGKLVATDPATGRLPDDIIAKAPDADRLDGLDAAGAADPARAGKLVATDPATGRLPDDIIAKAPDADRLDGLDADELVEGATVRHEVVTCPAAGFLPGSSGQQYSTSGQMRYSTAGTQLSCGLSLPTGALLRTITFDVQDSDAAANAICQARRFSPSPSPTGHQLALVVTSGSPGATSPVANVPPNLALVGPTWSYDVLCVMGTDTNIGVYGVHFAYDITQAGTTPPA